MTTIRKLDLGGTMCRENDDTVAISLDGSTSDANLRNVVIGDYNHMPFPDSTFDEAFGSCYMEGSDRATGSRPATPEEIEDHDRWVETVRGDPLYDNGTLDRPMTTISTHYNDYSELNRVLQPGAKVRLTGCGGISEDFDVSKITDDLESLSVDDYVSLIYEEMVRNIVEFTEAGFKVSVECRNFQLFYHTRTRSYDHERREFVDHEPKQSVTFDVWEPYYNLVKK